MLEIRRRAPYTRASLSKHITPFESEGAILASTLDSSERRYEDILSKVTGRTRGATFHGYAFGHLQHGANIVPPFRLATY